MSRKNARRPANKGAFVFGLVMTGAFVAGLLIFNDDLSERTMRGFPVWVLLVGGAICFALFAARSWFRPYSED